MTVTVDRWLLRWNVDDVDHLAEVGVDPAQPEAAARQIAAELDALPGADGEQIVVIDRLRVSVVLRPGDLPGDRVREAVQAGLIGSSRRDSVGDSDRHLDDGRVQLPGAERFAASDRTRAPSRTVTYPHLPAAVADLVRRSVVGDTDRNWAHQLIGLRPAAGTGPEAPSEADIVLAALSRVPRQAPAILEDLCHRGGRARLLTLLRRLPVPAALDALVLAVTGAAPPRGVGDPVAARLDLLLAPALRPASPPEAAAGALRLHVVRAAAAASVPPAPTPTEPSPARADVRTADITSTVPLDCDPEPTTSDPTRPAPADTASVTERPTRRGDPVPPVRPDAPGLPATDSTPLIGFPRPAGHTRWAGLLFLVHLLPDLQPDPGRAELYGIGRRLLTAAAGDGPAPGDPAVLAFAGLAPDREPPTPFDAPIRDQVLLAGLRERIRPFLARPLRDRALLQQVLARRARIVMDPGWCDVELDLDEVDFAVRAAGLDLDPGWVPALGCVVRYRYSCDEER